MRRWLPPAALGALLALMAFGVVLALRTPPEPALPDRSDALARELRCPDCQGLSVADSPTQSALEIRRQINELMADGASDAEVRAHFVARYGEWILLAPSWLVLWVLPAAVVLAGVVTLGIWLVRRPAPLPDVGAVLSDEARRRLHEEADALDA